MTVPPDVLLRPVENPSGEDLRPIDGLDLAKAVERTH